MAKAWIVVYDIPEGSVIDNPSAEFRSFGFRINLSGWVFAEEDVNRALFTLNAITEVGGNWHKLAIADESMEDAVAMCARYINKEVSEHIQRANATATSELAETNEDTGEPLTPEERLAEARRYNTRANQMARRMHTLLRDMRSLSRRWGVASTQVRLTERMCQVASLQQRMYQQAATYSRATAELIRDLGHGNAMVQAALKGQVPGDILADYLQDKTDGNDETAEDLRKAFSK